MSCVSRWTTKFHSIHFEHYKSNHCEDVNNSFALIMHGWMGSSADVEELAMHLSSSLKSHVIAPDLPYHSKSICASPLTPSEAVKLILLFIRKLISGNGVAFLDLIGYSLGGRLSIELFNVICSDLKHENDVLIINSIALMSSSPPPFSSRLSTVMDENDKKIHLDNLIEASIKYSKEISSIKTKENFNEWLRGNWYKKKMWGNLSENSKFNLLILGRVEAFSEDQKKSWSLACRNLSKAFMSVWGDNSIKYRQNIPLLFIFGELDEKYEEFSHEFHNAFPRLHVHCISGAGHNVMFEEPQKVSRKILSFLISHRPSFADKSKDEKYFELSKISLEKYCLQLRKRVNINGCAVSERLGLLVRVQSQNGLTGIGDICPLPGLHESTLESCCVEVEENIIQRFQCQELKVCISCFDISILNWITKGLSNVSRNGIECSIFHLLSILKSRSIGELISTALRYETPSPVSFEQEIVHVNGVYPRNPTRNDLQNKSKKFHSQEIVNQATSDQLKTSCFRTVKLKVGGAESVIYDANLAINASNACKFTGKSLRLDANRAWNKSEFYRFSRIFAKSASSDCMEYIEEPVTNWRVLKSVMEDHSIKTHIPLALDETVDELFQNYPTILKDFKILVNHSVAVIVKPTVIGSLSNISKILQIVMEENEDIGENSESSVLQNIKSRKYVILSSTFESGVGLAWNSIIASVCNSIIFGGLRSKYGDERIMSHCSSLSHGLGTYQYLENDVSGLDFEHQCVDIVEGEATIVVQKCSSFLDLVAIKSNRIV